MMATLFDSSLWIDFLRPRSHRVLKQFIAEFFRTPNIGLAKPVIYEVLRYASDKEIPQIQAQFRTLPLLATPADLWTQAAKLGQACRRNGINAGAIDLLIAQVAIHHNAELLTFDSDFPGIASVSALSVKLLKRPAT